MAFLVATTSLPAVYRPKSYAPTTTAGTPHARAKSFLHIWNLEEKTGENSGHYIIASSRRPEPRPLERRTLVPKVWKIMKFIVATIVVASQPPERGQTAMPTARASGE